MNYKTIPIAILAFIIMPFIASAQKPHMEVTPAPLVVYGDSVKFTATITMPAEKVFKNQGEYIVRPEIGSTQFEPIRFTTSQLGTTPDKGFTIEVEGTALFKEDMIGNELEIEHEYVYKDGRKKEEFSDSDNLGKCCVTTGRLFATNGQYELMKLDYTPATVAPRKIVAQINFPQDVSKISTDYSKNDVQMIGNYLKQNPDATITVRGFASPEGSVERNKELADERSMAAKKWLVSALKKNGFKKYVNESAINIESTSEDWKGFYHLLGKSDIDQEKKNQILAAISTTESMQQTEEELYKIVKNKEQVEELMRPLRRATIVVASDKATRRGFTVAQIDSISNKVNTGEIPYSALQDIFNQEEYLQAYVRTNADQGKLTLLTSYLEVYPGQTKLYSDLAALTSVNMSHIDIVGGDDALVGVGYDRDKFDMDTEYDMDKDKFKFKYKLKEEDTDDPKKVKAKLKAEFDQTEKMLTKAYEAEPANFVTQNNLGAFYLSVGEFDKAKQYIEMSRKTQESEGNNYNMGVYYAHTGDYDKALQHFNKAKNVKGVEYNRGLAKLLTGDAEGALRDFKAYTKERPFVAIGHYLTAVAAAQTNSEQTMYTALEHAINRDKRLADVAQEDLQFEMYWNNKDFKTASDDDFTQLAEEEESEDDDN